MAKRTSIWDDPRIKEALRERQPNDIAIIKCPTCHKFGYYNEGSHFTCLPCDVTFYCCSEDEERPSDGRPYLVLDMDTVRLLSDIE